LFLHKIAQDKIRVGLLSALLLVSGVLVLFSPVVRSQSYTTVTSSSTLTLTGYSTASSHRIATTSLAYDYNLTETMVGGEPQWFRSCTWGEFLFIAGGTGSGLPPIAYIGGDPNLNQHVHVEYQSDVPTDVYFLTQAQKREWAYYVSLWPYQFCAPPFSGWTYGWQGTTNASFTATLPTSTCPCTFLIFNMNVMPAHIHLDVNGLGVVGQIPYQYAATSTITSLYTTTQENSSQQELAGWLISVALIAAVVVLILILGLRRTRH
jgi:hypothetical protein